MSEFINETLKLALMLISYVLRYSGYFFLGSVAVYYIYKEFVSKRGAGDSKK